jgi:cytosine/adenosine deaminase-related metal-dependent hydrolase
VSSPRRALLRAGFVLPEAGAEPIADGAVILEDGRTASLGRFSALRRAYPLAAERGGADLLALPALVDAHSHGRGLALVEQQIGGGPLELFLPRLTALTPLPARDEALVAGADLLATGIATAQVFFHRFSGPADYRAQLLETADGLERSGIDAELVLGITDRNEFVPPGTARGEPAFQPRRELDIDGFFALFDAFAEERGRPPTIGPIAPQWCSERIWREAATRGVRVHTHLLESAAQRATYRAEPVALLERTGVLDERLSVAHGVWLLPAEVAVLAARGVTLVHCPGSNARLGVGTARVRAWIGAGALVALGLDSLTTTDPPDAFAELREARRQAARLGAPLSARDVLALATLGGAAALGRAGELGRLAPGSAANVLLVRNPNKTIDPVDALVEHASRNDVYEVWTRGLLTVENGHPICAAEAAAARRRLRALVRRDESARRFRLAAIAEAEPLLREAWRLSSRSM